MPASRLVLNRHTHRLISNKHLFRLIFLSFVKKRFGIQTRLLSGDDRLFLNLGYEEDPPVGLPLTASDEPDRYCIQQYHHTATQADISGKRVLEISCGHGGGASYLTRTLQPACYTGLDLNRVAVEFCQQRYQLPNLDFVVGDAGELPFADASFDVVLNLEASHLYPDVPRFLAEVARVLTSGGRLLYTDFRWRQDVADWEAVLADAPLVMDSCIDVREDVLRGNEKNAAHKRAMIRHHGGLVRFADEATDWAFNEALRKGDLCYRLYCFTKK